MTQQTSDEAQKIIDYFFERGARVGQRDYDWVKVELSQQRKEILGEVNKLIMGHTFHCDKIGTSIAGLREKLKDLEK